MAEWGEVAGGTRLHIVLSLDISIQFLLFSQSLTKLVKVVILTSILTTHLPKLDYQFQIARYTIANSNHELAEGEPTGNPHSD
jgi:hypothetical protein